MPLQGPVPGERRIIAAKFGRCLYEQSFLYSGDREEVYSLWGYQKGSPAIIFPVTVDRQVVAVRQFRHGSSSLMLEVPGGIPKAGQSPIETAARELLEETGYEASRIINLGVQPWADAAAHDLRFTLLLGLDCMPVAVPALDRNEVLETVLVPLAQWYEKIWRGEISDNKVIGHSLLVVPHLGGTIRFEP